MWNTAFAGSPGAIRHGYTIARMESVTGYGVTEHGRRSCRRTAGAKSGLAFAAAFYLACCGAPTGPTQHESRSIPRDASESLRADLRMGAGTLKVSGGSSNWMQGDFTYNVASWKPEIRYSSSGGHGELTVEQPGSNQSHSGSTKNEWDLRLSNDIPTDLTAHMGAGEARLDLGTLSLRGLEIEMGAGELRLDLRGKPSHSYDARIRGGAGEATVYLPRDAGIYARASGGLGEIKAQGLRSDGDHWVNDAYSTSKVQVRLDIQGGVGQINLIAE